ncbi:MAG: Cof-type HAD-IIB family hydrolase [Chitinispirillaceae bacterium]|nr:Cof-type HAD-IIB family hydrolase [Chitinispirillaceae bacterium]
MRYRLFAFDLDGTLLNDKKEISPGNMRALREMAEQGAATAFATGRLGSSVGRYLTPPLDDTALLILNGAEVYTGRRRGAQRVHYAPLACTAADFLIGYAQGREFACNYYIDDRLYAVRDRKTAPWIDVYVGQTGSRYQFVPSLGKFRGRRPSKVIFVGAAAVIDKEEHHFRKLWGDAVYVCRTWDHYLEFLDPLANKAAGLGALADAYGVGWPEIVAFGDAANDIPMLEKAGLGVAMANAPDDVKRAASRVSPWTNDDDGVAKEWKLIRQH